MRTRWLRPLKSRLAAVALLGAGVASAAAALFGASLGVVFYDKRFGLLDDGTGAYTQVSNLPITTASAGVAALNNFYYLEDFGNNLFTVDPVTGAANRVGNTGMNLWEAAFAGTLSGLYEVDQSSDLYSIDPHTGTARKVGATGIAAAGGRYDTSLASDGTSLYYTAGLGGGLDELYRIDVVTGVALDLGSTGVRNVAGSAFSGGRLELFQYGQTRNYIYSAVVGSTSFQRGAQLGDAAQIIDGAAFLAPGTASGGALTSIPEPNTILLSAIGLMAAAMGVTSLGRRRA